MKLGQTTERKRAKSRNETRPNYRMKTRQITELSIFLFIFAANYDIELWKIKQNIDLE